jgi:hypothetical protein
MWDTAALHVHLSDVGKKVKVRGIPHHAKNERDMGHPTICGRDKREDLQFFLGSHPRRMTTAVGLKSIVYSTLRRINPQSSEARAVVPLAGTVLAVKSSQTSSPQAFSEALKCFLNNFLRREEP